MFMSLPFHTEAPTLSPTDVFKTSFKLSVHRQMKMWSLNMMKEQTFSTEGYMKA